jgi:hypothetical protein
MAADDGRRCPTHPRFPAEDCPVCEHAIERAEMAREEPSDEQDYSKWSECGVIEP